MRIQTSQEDQKLIYLFKFDEYSLLQIGAETEKFFKLRKPEILYRNVS